MRDNGKEIERIARAIGRLHSTMRDVAYRGECLICGSTPHEVDCLTIAMGKRLTEAWHILTEDESDVDKLERRRQQANASWRKKYHERKILNGVERHALTY